MHFGEESLNSPVRNIKPSSGYTGSANYESPPIFKN
jgi:hypothetical protein